MRARQIMLSLLKKLGVLILQLWVTQGRHNSRLRSSFHLILSVEISIRQRWSTGVNTSCGLSVTQTSRLTGCIHSGSFFASGGWCTFHATLAIFRGRTVLMETAFDRVCDLLTNWIATRYKGSRIVSPS